MEIYGIKAYTDNYIWWIEGEKERILVDPGQSGPVLDHLKDKEEKKTLILLTHKHEDHVGGVEGLKKALAGLTVYGPAETGSYNDVTLKGGDALSALGQKISVLACPGHTEGHLAYKLGDRVFTGDALFMAGCGRVFTGDYRAQYQSLQMFKALPDASLIYPGHEYSLSNLIFAQSLFQENKDIDRTLKKVKDQRERGENSLPTTIALEKKINPFFLAKNLEDFIAYRKQKDQA